MIKKIGIDIGSCFIRTVVPERPAEISSEPSVIAVSDSGKVLGFGSDALKTDTCAPGSVQITEIMPSSGRLPAPEYLTAVFSAVLKKNKRKGANVYLSLPSGYNDEEAEALFVDAAQRAGARDVFTVDPGYAATTGCRIGNAGNSLIVNIGYKCVSMSAYSRGKEIASGENEFAGSAYDSAISSYITKKHHISLTREETDRIKKEICTLIPSEENRETSITALHCAMGLPKKITLTGEEILSAAEPVFDEFADGIIALIRNLPCEPDKIILTGGGACLGSLAPALAPLVCVPVKISEEPELAVIRGISDILLRQARKK